MISYTNISIADDNFDYWSVNNVLYNIDVIITRLWSYINFFLCTFIIIYNIYHLIKNPISAPPKIFITLQLFCICTLYSITFMLPLTETEDSRYKTYLYFTLTYTSTISKVFCSTQAVLHASCLLSMLTISFCILISSYFRLFKQPLDKKVEIIVCMIAWIVPLLVCLCSLFGEGEMAIDDNNLCWPKNIHWRLIYDILFCLIYLLNLIVIVVIVVKICKAKMQNIKKYVIKILLLGSVLITLSFYLYNLSHSLYVNFCLTFEIKTKEEIDSINHNMFLYY